MSLLLGFILGCIVAGSVAAWWPTAESPLPEHMDTPTLKATLDDLQRELWRRS